MSDVLIAYSSEDEKVTRILCAMLENAGIAVWYAGRDIPPGDFIPSAIADAMRRCRLCVFIFSKSSIYSEYLADELRYATKLIREERRNIYLVPLMIDAEGKSVFSEETINHIVCWDATKPPLEARLEEFAQELARILREPQESAS